MREKKSRRRRWPLWVVPLAVVCVAAAELLACSLFAPDLFRQIADPVRRAAVHISRSVVQAGIRAREELAERWQELTTKPPPPLPQEEVQDAGEPALPNVAPPSDPAITELRQQDGQEILTGGTVEIVYYNQTDAAWAKKRYGTDPLGRYGCGPTALAMAAASFGGDFDPETVARLSRQQGCWASRSGSYHSIVERVAPLCGMEAVSLTEKTPEAVERTLLSGGILIALMGPGHFTGGGHFILLRGVTLSGTLLVADPASRERSVTEWEISTVLEELSASTANGSPLWVLHPAPDGQADGAPSDEGASAS